jgi:adenylate cyclase 10
MKIDDKLLDFLLMKSFQGNPLLSIALFESLLKSKKYIKVIECTSECVITKDLLDDNEVFDWSNLTIPYVYEKISSMMINSLLNFKETLLLKYACTIGTIFDIQTLDKINPLNLLIKREDLYQIIKKLCAEYVVEIFDDENIMRKSKKFLICKICFPFMREVLNQKFPVERSASLHAETAKLLTGGKKMYFFDYKVEGKILKRHLIYSEIDVLQEVESKIGANIPEKYKKRKIMNSDNLTLLFVKDFCARIFDRKFKNVLEGNLEVKIESRWEKVSYFIDRSWKIHFSMKIKINDNEDEIEIIIPIKDIYKNTRLNDGKILELIIAEYSFYIQNKEKEKVYFQSQEWIEIFNLDTAITFLKVVVNYNKYLYNFGYTQFPLYKPGYYIRKEKKILCQH